MTKKVLVSTLAAVVMASLTGCGPKSQEEPPKTESSTPAKAETSQPINVNFTQTGNLTKENPEDNSQAWLLLFDLPGNPAATVTLKFVDGSVCDLKGTQVECAEAKFNLGDRAEVEGEKEGQIVTVSKLTVLAE
jgi:predicted small lipoprotein YifL